MLKKWLRLLTPDANTGGNSSTPPDDKGQGSSPVGQVEEVVEEAAPETEEQIPEGGDPAAEQQVEEEIKPVIEVAAVLDKPEDEKLPFHKEPRFQELIVEKNKYKEEIETVRPAVEAHKALTGYMQTHGILSAELQNALEYLRMRRHEPLKAWEVIKGDYDALASYAGHNIPADLQAEIAVGTLSEPRAKEIAQARARDQHQQWQGKSQQEVQQQQAAQAIQGGLNQWDQSVRAKDPDFKPKKDNTAVDGKWEYVNMKLVQSKAMNPFQSPQQAIQAAETALSEANKFFGSFRQVQTKKPAIKSNNTNTRSSAVVKTAEDVTKAILAGQKPHQLKYS